MPRLRPGKQGPSPATPTLFSARRRRIRDVFQFVLRDFGKALGAFESGGPPSPSHSVAPLPAASSDLIDGGLGHFGRLLAALTRKNDSNERIRLHARAAVLNCGSMRLEALTAVPALVKDVPLFADLEESQLQELLAFAQRQSFKAGETVFEVGDAAAFLRVLIEGKLSVHDAEGEMFEVVPPAPIGEQAAFSGESRVLRVVASDPSVILALPVDELEAFLRKNGDIGFVLQRNVVRLAARKIGRDRRRLREMRDNIVSTQQAMKQMRDAILDSDDNPLHEALYEELDSLIEQNRKVNYLVEPSRLVPTHVQLSGTELLPVSALSVEWLYFRNPPADLAKGQQLSMTLHLDGQQIPVSGQVERADEGEAIVYLDGMVPEYEERIVQHLARAQLLDVVM